MRVDALRLLAEVRVDSNKMAGARSIWALASQSTLSLKDHRSSMCLETPLHARSLVVARPLFQGLRMAGSTSMRPLLASSVRVTQLSAVRLI